MGKTLAPDQVSARQSAGAVLAPALAQASILVPATIKKPLEFYTGAPLRSRRLRGLDGLVDSAEPAVVFTALARLLVPQLCDRCEIVLVEQGTPEYRIAFPHRDSPEVSFATGRLPADVARRVLSTAIVGAPGVGRRFYGSLRCVWDAPRVPDDAAAVNAQLAIDYAVSKISDARYCIDVRASFAAPAVDSLMDVLMDLLPDSGARPSRFER